MSSHMEKIKEKLEQFSKKDLALRKTIAKRQDRLDARQNAHRAVERAIGVEPNQKWRGQEYQRSGHKNGHQMG